MHWPRAQYLFPLLPVKFIRPAKGVRDAQGIDFFLIFRFVHAERLIKDTIGNRYVVAHLLIIIVIHIRCAVLYEPIKQILSTNIVCPALSRKGCFHAAVNKG